MLHPNWQVAFLVIFTCLKNIHDMHLSVVSLRNFLAKNKQEKRVWCEIHHVIFLLCRLNFMLEDLKSYEILIDFW